MPAKKDQGAWFVYGVDYFAYPIGLYATELEALREVARLGYGSAVFWPFGTPWDEVK